MDPMLVARDFLYKTIYPVVRCSLERILQMQFTDEQEVAVIKVCYTYMAVCEQLKDPSSTAGSDEVLNKMLERFRTDEQIVHDQAARNFIREWIRCGDSSQKLAEYKILPKADRKALRELIATAQFLFEPCEDGSRGDTARETLSDRVAMPPQETIDFMESFSAIALLIESYEESVKIPSDGSGNAAIGLANVDQPKRVANAFLDQWAQLDQESPGELPDFENLSLEEFNAVSDLVLKSAALFNAYANPSSGPGTSQAGESSSNTGKNGNDTERDPVVGASQFLQKWGHIDGDPIEQEQDFEKLSEADKNVIRELIAAAQQLYDPSYESAEEDDPTEVTEATTAGTKDASSRTMEDNDPTDITHASTTKTEDVSSDTQITQ